MNQMEENFDDKLHDECGVYGVYIGKGENGELPKDANPAATCYFGLYSLQHRGQESAGIAVYDGKEIKVKKDVGLVGDVFSQEDLKNLSGYAAVGHVRYSTAGGKGVENAQPMVSQMKLGSVAVAHNGQLVNYEQLREMLEETGSTFNSSSDTEVIVKLIAKSDNSLAAFDLISTLSSGNLNDTIAVSCNRLVFCPPFTLNKA